MEAIERVHTLTFDIFGTVLDLAGTIVPALEVFLANKACELGAADFWGEWRARQRIEQFQDSLLMLGHGGYLEVARRALVYTLRRHKTGFDVAEVEQLLRVFENLEPFEDAKAGLGQLAGRYRLVALSNGNQWLLDHLVANQMPVRFEAAISVDRVGRFKPHPAVYRLAARALECEPAEILMVAAHSFDILGARACGFRGAYVNRYGLPYEDSPLRPDVTVRDFRELASWLGSGEPGSR